MLLRLLLEAFGPHGPVVLALDDMSERRWGRHIRAREICRDPVPTSSLPQHQPVERTAAFTIV